MDIEKQLESLGLKPQETKIYLECLEKGESKLAQICRDLKIPRSTAKYSLEKLQRQGLLNIVQKNKSQLYVALPPKHIISTLKSQKEKIDEQIETIQNSLPQLNHIYSSSSHEPRVRYFKDKEIRNIYEEILDSPIDETLFIGEMDKTAEVIGLNYLKSWMKRRSELRIKTRAIRVEKGELKDSMVNSDSKKYLRSVRLAPANFESPNHIIIYGNNVATISTTKENFGFVITSNEYAITMKNLFKEVWRNSSPF
ncbi:MAG: transcriptional regulator, TrmB [uncultured bacterium]|nr:MAG: transcriptional regulator, TrmB [uncultured bacterium]